MKRFKKVAIIGVGLIGGSIGLAIKRKKVAGEVVGVFRRRSTLRRALKCKAVDKGVLNVREGVIGADLVVIATPVSLIPKFVKEAARYAKKGAIITDAGSTKGWILKEVEKALGRSTGVSFVGSHPMAGSEHNGVEFARSTLLEEAPCIVTRTRNTDMGALRNVIGFWSSLGARVEIMSPAEHDKRVALISHLPHLVAFSIAGAVPEKDIVYAAEGFKDTTRVASSDPRLWADIFFTNKKDLTSAARIFERYYKGILGGLSKNSYAGVVKLLGRAKAKRDKFFYEK